MWRPDTVSLPVTTPTLTEAQTTECVEESNNCVSPHSEEVLAEAIGEDCSNSATSVTEQDDRSSVSDSDSDQNVSDSSFGQVGDTQWCATDTESVMSENADSDKDQDKDSVRLVQDDCDTDDSETVNSVSDGDQKVCASDKEDNDSLGAEEQLALVASRLQQLFKSLPSSKLSLPVSHVCQVPSFVTTI